MYVGESDWEVALAGTVFAIDATTIDLCLSTFHRARFRSTKAGIKLHTRLDLKTSIPAFLLFSNASVHDVKALDVITFEQGSFYVLDKGGYIDYKRLYRIHLAGAFFIIRAKDNMNFRRLYSHAMYKKKGGCATRRSSSIATMPSRIIRRSSGA